MSKICFLLATILALANGQGLLRNDVPINNILGGGSFAQQEFVSGQPIVDQVQPIQEVFQQPFQRLVQQPVAQPVVTRQADIVDGVTMPYDFDYEVQNDDGSVHFRRERQDGQGNLVGTYGFTTADGISRTVEYSSTFGGGMFQHVITNEPGTESSQPADVVIEANPIQVDFQQQQVIQDGRTEQVFRPRNFQAVQPLAQIVEERPQVGFRQQFVEQPVEIVDQPFAFRQQLVNEPQVDFGQQRFGHRDRSLVGTAQAFSTTGDFYTAQATENEDGYTEKVETEEEGLDGFAKPDEY